MLARMAHRPRPHRERALRQILRHHRYDLPPELAAFTRPAPEPTGVYFLSTRRPGVVGGWE
jgi:hypothetical protein